MDANEPLVSHYIAMRARSDVCLIGRQGEDKYLLEVEPINGESMGRVLDLAQKRLFPIAPLASLLARGYWEEYGGKPGELEYLLALVKHTASANTGSATNLSK